MEKNNEFSSLEQKFSVNVLQLIKSSQMQHGLRHRDYTRYRRYCSARLRRLYKSLKFTHGRGRYSQRAINEYTVTEVRFLHMVLYMAERAWSHAMEKRSLPDGPTRPQRMYLIGRLRKAVNWASLFAQLCDSKGDPRTSLEAEAYASYMKGTLLFEKETNWDGALMNFKRARAVYEKLSEYGSIENQNLCRERVEELEPTIRYCCHEVEKSNIQLSEFLDDEDLGGPALDLFKAKLEAVLADTRSQQAASLTEFYWLGHKFPLTNSKIRLAIIKAQELETNLHGSTSLPVEKKLAIFDKIFAAYNEARSHIRSDLLLAAHADDTKDGLTGLDKAVSALLGQRVIERNQLLVSNAKSRSLEKGDKILKPQELVRLYDLLVQSTADLCDLVNSSRDRKPEEVAFVEEYTLKYSVFRAHRCFYLAKSYGLAGKRVEAYVLYDHTRSLIVDALEKFQAVNKHDKGTVQELEALSISCRANICTEHAEGILEEENTQEKLTKGVSNMSLQVAESVQSEKFLLDNLNNYQSAVGAPDSKGVSHIVAFPTAFQAIPCTPIVFDIAYEYVDFPSLEHRVKKDKKGIFSRLWGK